MKIMEYYIINKINQWTEEFSTEECVFLDIMADSSAESIVRLWGNMPSTDRKWWPSIFYAIYNTERQLPCDILPNLKPGRRIDLKKRNMWKIDFYIRNIKNNCGSFVLSSVYSFHFSSHKGVCAFLFWYGQHGFTTLHPLPLVTLNPKNDVTSSSLI